MQARGFGDITVRQATDSNINELVRIPASSIELITSSHRDGTVDNLSTRKFITGGDRVFERKGEAFRVANEAVTAVARTTVTAVELTSLLEM